MMIQGVLFDLDGTLLDSAPDLVAALNHVRESEGMAPVEVGAYRRFVSRGALGLINAGMPQADEAQLERRKTKLLDHYAGNSMNQTKPFDGIAESLDTLASWGIPWGIVTNKPEFLTLPILEHLGWKALAGCVICGDTLAWKKPHPAPVTIACELLRLPPEKVVMVGDDLRDIESGRKAGAHTAWAAYGYVNGEVSDEDLAGSFILDAPADLLSILPQSDAQFSVPPSP